MDLGLMGQVKHGISHCNKRLKEKRKEKTKMLPIILGAVALTAIGFGVKILVDDEFRDKVRDTIQEGAIKGYELIEKVEEKLGLYDYDFRDDDEFKRS